MKFLSAIVITSLLFFYVFGIYFLVLQWYLTCMLKVFFIVIRIELLGPSLDLLELVFWSKGVLWKYYWFQISLCKIESVFLLYVKRVSRISYNANINWTYIILWVLMLIMHDHQNNYHSYIQLTIDSQCLNLFACYLFWH